MSKKDNVKNNDNRSNKNKKLKIDDSIFEDHPNSGSGVFQGLFEIVSHYLSNINDIPFKSLPKEGWLLMGFVLITMILMVIIFKIILN